MSTQMTLPAKGMAEIAIREHQSESASIMAIITAAARDPQVDIDKMERLLAMKERMDEQQRKADFACALLSVQSKRLQVRRSKQGKNSKYAPLEDIDKHLAPVLQEHGLSVSFNCTGVTETGLMNMVLRIYHQNGYFEDRMIPMPIDDIGTNREGKALRPKIQDHGSTVSYSRRALLKMAFNVVETDEDDDGQMGKDLEPITQDQADTLRSKCEEYGFTKEDKARVGKFASTLQGKVIAGLSDIRQCDYRAVLAVIEDMRK